jgi:hypothetical protein
MLARALIKVINKIAESSHQFAFQNMSSVRTLLRLALRLFTGRQAPFALFAKWYCEEFSEGELMFIAIRGDAPAGFSRACCLAKLLREPFRWLRLAVGLFAVWQTPLTLFAKR